MARIKIELPEKFIFSTNIPLRITDINYGGHLGNDTVLSIVHEARLQFLKHLQCSELNFFGAALIMADAAIEFKNESFYGDELNVKIAVTEISKVGFDLVYLIQTQRADKTIVVAKAKTGMICFDYSTKKIIPVPTNIPNFVF